VKTKIFLAVAIALSLGAAAQTSSQTTTAVEPISATPTSRVNVVSRTVQAVNYRHRSGATKLDFAGTDLMPSAKGQAKIKQGVTTNPVSAKGFGNTLPVASNDDSAGRQQNRRVELVVSGNAIGNAITTTGSLQ